MADETGSADAPQTETAATAPVPPPIQAPETTEADEPDDWSPPNYAEDGTALDGHGLPINLRLRRYTLADEGKKEDPTGQIPPEDIAAEVERLAAYDKEYPPLAKATKADLEKIAKDEEVDLSTAATNDERAALIQAGRPSRS